MKKFHRVRTLEDIDPEFSIEEVPEYDPLSASKVGIENLLYCLIMHLNKHIDGSKK